MNILRKRWRLILMVLLLPLVLGGVAIAWLCYTASGLQFALLQLNRVPTIAVSVQGVTGMLAGPLHVDHLSVDHERIHIDIEQLDIELTPAYLLSGLIDLKRLQIRQITAQLKPPLHDTPEQPIHFLPAFLRINIDQLALQRAQYTHTNGYTVSATPLNARVQVSRSSVRVQQLNAVTQEFDARGDVVLEASITLRLTAHLDAAYKLSNGPVLRGRVNAAGAVTGEQRALTLTASLQQPHVAQINAVLALPDSGWSLQGTARAAQVLLDAWWPQPTFSLRDLNLQFALNDAGMHYVGDTVVPEWSPQPLHLDADTRYVQRVFTVLRADISMPHSGVRTHSTGTISLQSPGKPLLDMHGSWDYLQWPLHASRAQAFFTSTQGALTLRGTFPYRYELSGHIALPNWPDSIVQARGELRSGAIDISDYAVQTLQGKASGTAQLAFTPPRAWQFNLQATDINVGELQAAWPSRLNVQASAAGQGWDRNALFDLQLSALSGSLRNQPINAKGHVQRQAKRWTLAGVTATWGRAQLTAQGSVGEQNNLQWSLVAPMLKQLHPDLSGDLSMSGFFSGNVDEPLLTLRAQSQHAAYAAWQMDGVTLDTHIDVTDRSASRIELSAARLAQGDNALRNVQLQGAGQTAAHQLSLRAQLVQSMLPMGLQLQLQSSGGYGQGKWQGTVSSLQVSDAQHNSRVNLVAPAQLLLARQQLQLSSLCLSVDSGRFCTHADWLNDAREGVSWDAHATLQDLPLSISNDALAQGARLQARVNGQLDLSAAPKQAWLGAAQLTLADATLGYQLVAGREQQLPISLAQLSMQAEAHALRTTAELRMGEQTVTSLTATLDRSGGAGFGSWPLSGVLAFSSSDAKLIPVFVPEVDHASGTLAAALKLSGTATQPRFAGDLHLLQGELDFYQLNLALRELSVDAQVDTDRLRFQARGNAGEGLLNASGDLTWRDAKLFGNLQIKGERLLLADLPEYHVLATPDLNFVIDDRNVAVKGEVLIPEARLQPKEVVGAVQASTDARFKNDKLLARDSAWLINSGVTIRLGDKVSFDGLGLQGQLSGAIDTRLRTGEVASGSGDLSINEGRYEAYGQKLDIKRGRLIYDSTPLTDPGLDIQAERKINDTTVGVYVRGVLRAPRLQFYSDASLSQSQIVSYLLVGKPLDELQGQEATTVRSASNTLAMQGGGYLASQLGRRIGLEEVGVETDDKNQSALVLGKFLSPRLFVSYGISLTEALNTIKLRYTLSQHWTIKTEAGDAKSADLEFKIEH